MPLALLIFASFATLVPSNQAITILLGGLWHQVYAFEQGVLSEFALDVKYRLLARALFGNGVRVIEKRQLFGFLRADAIEVQQDVVHEARFVNDFLEQFCNGADDDAA